MSAPSDGKPKLPTKTTKSISPLAKKQTAAKLLEANQANESTSSSSLPGQPLNLRRSSQSEVATPNPPLSTRRSRYQMHELEHLRGPRLQTFGDQPGSSNLSIELGTLSGNDKAGSSNQMNALTSRETTPPTPLTIREQTNPPNEPSSSNQPESSSESAIQSDQMEPTKKTIAPKDVITQVKPYEPKKPRVHQPVVLPETQAVDRVEPDNTNPAEAENPIVAHRENPDEGHRETRQNENNDGNINRVEDGAPARNATPNTIGTPASNELSETGPSNTQCPPVWFPLKCSCSIQ